MNEPPGDRARGCRPGRASTSSGCPARGGRSLLVLLDACHEPVTYVLPEVERGQEWEALVDTAGASDLKRDLVAARGAPTVEARSIVVRSRPASR